MSSHPTDFQGSVIEALREAIERKIPGSRAEVNGGGGHFAIEVTGLELGTVALAATVRKNSALTRGLEITHE